MHLRRMLVLFSIIIATSLVVQDEAFAENVKEYPQSFHYKINYNELYLFLGISEDKYKSEWKKGKSINEIAKANNIPQTKLVTFFGELQFKALDKAINRGEIDKDFYYNYAISHMEEEIMQIIHQNPNKGLMQ